MAPIDITIVSTSVFTAEEVAFLEEMAFTMVRKPPRPPLAQYTVRLFESGDVLGLEGEATLTTSYALTATESGDVFALGEALTPDEPIFSFSLFEQGDTTQIGG